MAIALALDSITEDMRSLIVRSCSIKPNKSQYNSNPDLIDCFAVNKADGNVYVPLGIWKDFLDEFPEYGNDVWHLTNMRCTKTLYTTHTDPKRYRDQDVVASLAYKKLMADHTVFIAASPGFGKTSMGNYLACKLKLKTLIICHIDKVNTQWVNEFKSFSTAKVHLIKGNNKIDYTADVYVIGVLKAANLNRSDFYDMGIGTVIFDEAHIATITAFSNSLLKICPKYVIGLSATPERSDGMQKILKMYFGPKKEYISRQEVKDFIVYKYETEFVPSIQYKFVYGNTILDWTNVINSLAYNTDRQHLIAKIAMNHPEHKIIILSDRIDECVGIYNFIIDELSLINGMIDPDANKDVYLMDETNKKDGVQHIQKYRILIAGKKRAGVGFDDPTRTMLILCTDCRDVRQNEGRIRTTNNIIYDIVDNNLSLESHWKLRAAWYEKRGARVNVIPRKSSREYVSTTRKLPPNLAS